MHIEKQQRKVEKRYHTLCPLTRDILWGRELKERALEGDCHTLALGSFIRNKH